MKNIIPIISAITLLSSCEKELDFDYHDIEPILVIQGETTGSETTVHLSLTSAMDSPFGNKHITDANVILTDLTNGKASVLAADESGVFRGNTGGTVGHEYQLDVNYNGKTYSSTSIMPAKEELLNLEFKWIKMPYDYVAVLQTTFTDPAETGNCYWLRLFRNGKDYKWSLVKDDLSVNGTINNVLMTTRQNPDDADDKSNLYDGDIISVSVTPISQRIFDYLVALENNSNGSCQFTGGYCVGYYLAAPISKSSITYNPEEITEYKQT